MNGENTSTPGENFKEARQAEGGPDSAINLLPGETITSNEQYEIQTPSEYPSALKALKLLTSAERVDDIGENGPSVASRATEANKDNVELRLYEVLFGRDSLRVASDLLDRYPKLAKSKRKDLVRKRLRCS